MRMLLRNVPNGGVIRRPGGTVALVMENSLTGGWVRLAYADGRILSLHDHREETVELLTTTWELALVFMEQQGPGTDPGEEEAANAE